MKKKLFICFLLIGNLMGNVMAQDIITNPLLFVFKLHGQTRKYQFTFNQSNDTLYLHWGIERNTRWQSGSYAMPQEALKNGGQTKLLTAGRRTAYLSLHSRNLCPTFSNRFSGIEKPKGISL